MKQKLSSGKGCLFIFGLPFAVVGVGSYGIILWLVYQYFQTANWVTVPAQLLSAEIVDSSSSDHGSTMKPTAKYKYSFNGEEYVGEQVALLNMSDNFGRFQVQLGEKLKQHLRTHTPIDCYVDPGNPSNAVLNREIRYEVLAFFSAFALMFGVIGIALVVGCLFTNLGDGPGLDERGYLESSAPESPAIATALLVYAFGLALPLVVLFPAEVQAGHYGFAAFGGVMAVVFIFIIRACVKVRSQLLSYGRSRLQIKQLKISEEGSLQGTIHTDKSQVTNSLQLKAKLSCIQEGRGDDSQTTLFKMEETVTGNCLSGTGMTIPLNFKFKTPAKLSGKDKVPDDVEFRIDISTPKGAPTRFETKFAIKSEVANKVLNFR